MLTPKQINFLQEELSTAKNPLFLYDADSDGLASFILLYKMHREGVGIRVAMTSKIDLQFMRRVEEINPDKIFVLDIPLMEQEFVDAVKRPVIWIDHHEPQEINKVHYFNPRINEPGAYIPVTRLAYQISENPDDLWIAAAGCLGDWYMPDFIDEFIKKYPDLLPEKTDLSNTLYKNPVGMLVKFFFFVLKGPSSEVRKSVKILTRINSPNEILKQESPAGKYLYKRFETINNKYEEILHKAKEKVTRSRILVYYYSSDQWSFTANLANELRATYPNKVVIIARRKSGEIKCSLRGGEGLLEALKKALVGIDGHGGGHPNACGAVIKEEDWKRFLKNFKEEIKQLHKKKAKK